MTDGSTGDAAGRLAVALSGGGYRATAWSLGVLWALVNAGVNREVTMISSVSGGSIANSFAGLGPAYSAIAPGEFGERARRLAGRLAGCPGAWLACLVGTLLAGIAGWAVIGTDGPGLIVAAAAAVLFGVAGSATAGDLVFNRLAVWLYIDLLLAAVGAVVWAWPLPWLTVAAIVLLAVLALARGPVVGWALGRSVQSLCPGRKSRLDSLNPEPLHVFLATELRAGHHAAFARNFVYCYDLGLGSKPSLPIRSAVQASANLPGAFPTRWIRTSDMGLVGGDHTARWMALTDGGVYDNMGDQWPMGLNERIGNLAGRNDVKASRQALTLLDDWRSRRADFVIVANASGALGFRSVWSSALPLAGELIGLLKVKDVLYDNGNSVRRTSLIKAFDAGDPQGTLIHITSTPYSYLGFATGARADEARDWLEGTMPKTDWEVDTETACGVGTQFWPLGRAKTRAVFRCAYAQTMVNLHVKLGTPLVKMPDI